MEGRREETVPSRYVDRFDQIFALHFNTAEGHSCQLNRKTQTEAVYHTILYLLKIC